MKVIGKRQKVNVGSDVQANHCATSTTVEHQERTKEEWSHAQQVSGERSFQ